MTRDILGSIAVYKREEVAKGRREHPLRDMEARAANAPTPRGFHRALKAASQPGRPALIAEIKRASPSRGMIRKDFDPAALAQAYEGGGATCLSVLTDGPSFQGSAEALQAARRACRLPCLRKDFLVDVWQVAESRAMGADAILVILAMVDDSLARELMAAATRLHMDALVEVHDERELLRALSLGSRMIGINNRDLHTFVTDLEVTERLAPRVPQDILLVSESGIEDAQDMARLGRMGVSAALVGESLMRKPDVEGATLALLGD